MDTLTTQVDQLEAQITALHGILHRLQYNFPNLAAIPKTGLEGFPRVQACLVEQEAKRAQNDPTTDPDLFERLSALEFAIGQLDERTGRLNRKVNYIINACNTMLTQIKSAQKL